MFAEESMKMLSCDKEKKKKSKAKVVARAPAQFLDRRDRVNALLCNIVGT